MVDTLNEEFEVLAEVWPEPFRMFVQVSMELVIRVGLREKAAGGTEHGQP